VRIAADRQPEDATVTKLLFRYAFILVTAAGFAGTVRAQPATFTYNFGQTGGTATPTSGSALYVTAGDFSPATFSDADPQSDYAGASADYYIVQSTTVAGALNIATSTYFEVTFTPTTSAGFILTGFDFGVYSASDGPVEYSIRSSADSFGSSIADGLITVDDWTFTTNSFSQQVYTGNTAVTFRIYTFGNLSSGMGEVRLDDVTISVTPEPVTTFAAAAGGLGLFGLIRRKYHKSPVGETEIV
jgi:hypothetical protein